MEHAHTQCMYTQCMHVSISMRGWLHRRTDRRCGRAAHTRARAASVRARVCVCDWAATHPAPTHASAFRRRGPRVARLAGVPLGGGVQREHRRVEHRRSHHVARGMRRSFRPGRRATAGGTRSVGSSMRRGPLCAAATADARARECAQTCGHAHARVCACVGIAARTKDGIYVCMYTCIYIYVSISICMHYTYICR